MLNYIRQFIFQLAVRTIKACKKVSNSIQYEQYVEEKENFKLLSREFLLVTDEYRSYENVENEDSRDPVVPLHVPEVVWWNDKLRGP